MKNIMRFSVQDFGQKDSYIRFDSQFSDSGFHISGYELDKAVVIALKDWLDAVLDKYEQSAVRISLPICQNCNKDLPRFAQLDNYGYWVVTCLECNSKHEVGNCHA